jgi:Ca-activated chloride channel family protein
MLRFQHSNYLLALAIIPVLVLLYLLLLVWRRQKLKKLGDEHLVKEQIIGLIPGRRTLKFILLTLALATGIIGWANLQSGGKAEQVERKGVDVIIALDVSKSMLAKDIQPDRLTRSKQLIERMLDKMKNDRVGLVIFAGRAYLQVPLTIDYSSMRMMLQNVRPDLVPSQGTVISDAIDLSLQSFSKKEKKYKSLIIISDGEDHDAKAKDKTIEAVEQGLIVHTVGVGSPQGAPLYDENTKSEKLDEQGQPVISKLNEEELKSIAATGNGTYTLLNNANDAAARLTEQIDAMEQRNMGTVAYTNYNSYFQYFLLPAFLLLIAEWLIPGAKNRKQKLKTA